MDLLKQVWLSLRSNPIFVAAYSAAAGAIVSCLEDERASGRIDWTHSGLNKLMGYAFTAAIFAVIHMYTPPPGTNPKQ